MARTARRDAGEGGISQRQDGTWMGQFNVGHKMVPDKSKPGQMKKVPTRKTVYAASKAECRDKLRAARDAWQAEQDRKVKTPATYTLHQCIEDWLADERLKGIISEKTIAKAEGQARIWIYPKYGSQKLARMYAPDFEEILLNAATGNGKRSLGDIKSIMVRAVHRAMKGSPPLIDANYAQVADLPGKCLPPRPKMAMDRDMIAAVMQAAEGTRHHAMMAVSIYMGLRPGELRCLMWADVLWDENVLWVRRGGYEGGGTKNPWSERRLAIPKLVSEPLRAWQEAQQAEREAAGPAWHDNDLVFCYEDGRPYDSDGLAWYYGQITKKAGLGALSPYKGRFTLVSVLFDANVNSNKIAEQVGHKSDIVTKLVYKQVISTKQTDAADAIDGAFG